MNEHETLINQLEKLAQNNQPKSNFVDSLEAQLRATHLELQPEKISIMSRVFKSSERKKEKRKRRPVSPMRWLVAMLSIVIVLGFIWSVPPVRYAVSDFFYPPELEFFQVDEAYADVSTYPDDMTLFDFRETEPYIWSYPFYGVETVADAYDLYEDDFLALPEQGGIALSHVSAAFNAVYLVYDVEYENKPTNIRSSISLYQLVKPSGFNTPMTAIGMSHEENVRVRGSRGTYARAIWNLRTSSPEAKLEPFHGIIPPPNTYYRMGRNAHRLAWQDGDIVYILTMSEFLADDVSDIVAIAEQLVPYVPDED